MTIRPTAFRRSMAVQESPGDPRIRPGSTPGWTTLNVRAAWEASEHVYTALHFGNIGDRRYREFGSGLDAAGRGIVLTLELRL